ncbi:unnamed protein product [Effrenium voratum]|nr:unnamed protein product [Effrenium voratum]
MCVYIYIYIAPGAELEVVTCSFCRALPGRWEPAVEDYSAWMRRMTIAEDGTFTCQSGDITDGLVRLVSAQERKVNLKRTCHDANDHVFVLDEDEGSSMVIQTRRWDVHRGLTKQAFCLAGSQWDSMGAQIDFNLNPDQPWLFSPPV